MKNNNGQVAIVTGGARGIGLAICKKLKSLGYYVAVIDKNPDFGIDKSAMDFQFKGDVSIEYEVKEFMEMLIKDTQILNNRGITVLINNAGVASAKKFMDLQLEDFKEMMETNVYGSFFMSKAFIAVAGEGYKKDIINISSVSGLMGFSGHSHYCASKFALDGMSKVMAKELSKLGNYRVNNICPGPTQTDMWIKLDKEYKENGFMPEEANEDDYAKKLLIKRMGKPEDVAEAVEYLLKSDYTTGINLPVCGGNILR